MEMSVFEVYGVLGTGILILIFLRFYLYDCS